MKCIPWGSSPAAAISDSNVEMMMDLYICPFKMALRSIPFIYLLCGDLNAGLSIRVPDVEVY